MAAEPQRVAWGRGAEALLDAAERLLVTEGRDGLTTRAWRARYGIWAFQNRECTTSQVGSSRIVWSPPP